MRIMLPTSLKVQYNPSASTPSERERERAAESDTHALSISSLAPAHAKRPGDIHGAL